MVEPNNHSLNPICLSTLIRGFPPKFDPALWIWRYIDINYKRFICFNKMCSPNHIDRSESGLRIPT
jgi:hypothetical protein